MNSSLFAIDHFQLDNLLYNRIPFKLIAFNESASPFFSGLQLMHLKTCEVSVAPSVENVTAYFKQENLPKDFAAVLICTDGETSKQIQKQMMDAGYVNVYYIKQGLQSLPHLKK